MCEEAPSSCLHATAGHVRWGLSQRRSHGAASAALPIFPRASCRARTGRGGFCSDFSRISPDAGATTGACGGKGLDGVTKCFAGQKCSQDAASLTAAIHQLLTPSPCRCSCTITRLWDDSLSEDGDETEARRQSGVSVVTIGSLGMSRSPLGKQLIDLTTFGWGPGGSVLTAVAMGAATVSPGRIFPAVDQAVFCWVLKSPGSFQHHHLPARMSCA
ncbi:uncharacterized protein LOC141933349 [Strix aluco]|uniref:uncharacterized protein LOC141933349 n=1 Tax=Strix aluco TaxID=111821 RepID=UPI003DA30194